VIGKFMTYHEAPHNFAEHEVNLAVTIARQVGFSLERAQAEAARRTAEDEMRESEERFRLMWSMRR
jgi:GAF domain-containing protein